MEYHTFVRLPAPPVDASAIVALPAADSVVMLHTCWRARTPALFVWLVRRMLVVVLSTYSRHVSVACTPSIADDEHGGRRENMDAGENQPTSSLKVDRYANEYIIHMSGVRHKGIP